MEPGRDQTPVADLGRNRRWDVLLLRPFLLCRAGRLGAGGDRNGLWASVLRRGLARQCVRHAVSSREEPSGWPADSKELCGIVSNGTTTYSAPMAKKDTTSALIFGHSDW